MTQCEYENLVCEKKSINRVCTEFFGTTSEGSFNAAGLSFKFSVSDRHEVCSAISTSIVEVFRAHSSTLGPHTEHITTASSVQQRDSQILRMSQWRRRKVQFGELYNELDVQKNAPQSQFKTVINEHMEEIVPTFPQKKANVRQSLLRVVSCYGKEPKSIKNVVSAQALM